MLDQIINIHLISKLLHIKTKKSRINKHKNNNNNNNNNNFFKKKYNLHFLPNNILTKLFKELKNMYKNNYQVQFLTCFLLLVLLL